MNKSLWKQAAAPSLPASRPVTERTTSGCTMTVGGCPRPRKPGSRVVLWRKRTGGTTRGPGEYCAATSRKQPLLYFLLAFTGSIGTYFIRLYNCWFQNEIRIFAFFATIEFSEYSITNNSGLLAGAKIYSNRLCFVVVNFLFSFILLELMLNPV